MDVHLGTREKDGTIVSISESVRRKHCVRKTFGEGPAKAGVTDFTQIYRPDRVDAKRPSHLQGAVLKSFLAAFPERMVVMNEPKDVDKVIADVQSLLDTLGFDKPPAKLEQLLVEVENLLKQAPPEPSVRTITGSPPVAWVGSASAVVSQWNSVRAIAFHFAQWEFVAPSLAQQVNGYRTIMMILHEAQRDLRLKTVGPLNVAIDKGRVFDYFEELTDIIKQATADLLFVDAYLDDEFISRYLPHAKSGVSIRLLTSSGKDPRRLGRLLPSAKLFADQNNQVVTVRTTAELHDRYLFVDHTRCFSSGASFKDGAKNAGTTIVQLFDIFDPVRDAYEKLWTAGES